MAKYKIKWTKKTVKRTNVVPLMQMKPFILSSTASFSTYAISLRIHIDEL